MDLNYLAILQAAMSIFAIVDPIGGLPVFISLTSDVNAKEQRYIFRVAGVVSMIAVLIMGLVGEILITQFLQIKIGAVYLAGGLLLLIFAIRTLLVGHQVEEDDYRFSAKASEDRRRSLLARAISPIACPLLLGPGSITASIMAVKKIGYLGGSIAIILAFLVVLAIMNWGHLLTRLLGTIGSIVIERIFMIFIAALGIDAMHKGLVSLFPQLGQVTGATGF